MTWTRNNIKELLLVAELTAQLCAVEDIHNMNTDDLQTYLDIKRENLYPELFDAVLAAQRIYH